MNTDEHRLKFNLILSVEIGAHWWQYAFLTSIALGIDCEPYLLGQILHGAETEPTLTVGDGFFVGRLFGGGLGELGGADSTLMLSAGMAI